MELVAGYPYWLIKTGLPYQYPKLLKNENCQAVIIGGGISGALTAYHCTMAGIKCILVDARSIGLGSTCASTSLLQYELDIPLHQLKKLVGNRNAVRSYQLCGQAVDKLIALMDQLKFGEYSKRQSLFFSLHSKEKKMLTQECIARKEAGFDVQLLTREELETNYGLKAEYGLLSQKGAANNAYLLTHELLQHSISRGLKVFDRTRLKTIDNRNNKMILRTENDCTLTCDSVINSSGYEVTNFIGKKIVDLDCTYAIISESMTKNNEMQENGIMMWSTDNPYMYLCPTNDSRIIIGGRDESFVNMKTMHTYLEKKSILLEKDFKKCFPSVSFKKEFAWSGVFGKTKDALPYIGKYPETSRVFYALGFGGNGITFSLIAAEIIADLILGKKNKDAEIFSFRR